MLGQRNAALYGAAPEVSVAREAVPGAEEAEPAPDRMHPVRRPGAVDMRPDRDRYVHVVKPAFDRAVALVALMAAVPLMASAAVAIRLTMGSGVIFVQTRVGKDGRLFRIYKFRTMRPDRRRRDVAVAVERRRTHKHPDDPRLTPVGRFLRKWSLDEVPQFVNVLLGDMSLVGPRPEMVEIVARYEGWQHGRHVVKPGLTGLWQISDRGDLLMHECVERDIEYISRLSWRTDLAIVVRTPAAMVGRRRGY